MHCTYTQLLFLFLLHTPHTTRLQLVRITTGTPHPPPLAPKDESRCTTHSSALLRLNHFIHLFAHSFNLIAIKITWSSPPLEHNRKLIHFRSRWSDSVNHLRNTTRTVQQVTCCCCCCCWGQTPTRVAVSSLDLSLFPSRYICSIHNNRTWCGHHLILLLLLHWIPIKEDGHRRQHSIMDNYKMRVMSKGHQFTSTIIAVPSCVVSPGGGKVEINFNKIYLLDPTRGQFR